MFPRQRVHATIELLEASIFIQSSRIKGESVGLSVYPLIVAKQTRSRGNEDFLEESRSVRSVSYQRKIGD
jgi:hypothetical protein